MRHSRRLFLAILMAGVLYGQQVVAPTPEEAGSPRGDTIGNYNVTQSFETGYRFATIGGDLGKYRSDVNYHDGIRLLGSSLSVISKDGHGRFFDEIVLNTLGLGNDPYQSAILRVEKNQLYRYDMTWRYNEYFNPGLTVAGGQHLADTGRRLQDHDLTLLPQSHIRFHVGYSRNTEDGPALSTAQEFDPSGSAYPVFTDVRRQWNEYRLSADVDFAGFKFILLHRWDYFKDDSPFSGGTISSGGAVPTTVLGPTTNITPGIQRSQPVHGSSPGWLGNLLTKRKYWTVNARISYVSGRNDFALNELATGVQSGSLASRQIVVGGDAKRPALAGDLNISLFPTERLTIVNNSAIHSNRIDGNSTYSEIETGFNLGTTINFRYLGVRTLVNSTVANYRAANWISFYAGYHYSDRLVRTVEGAALPTIADSFSSYTYNVTNILKSGTVGVRLRPFKPLTLNVEAELGRANQPLTPISDRNYHSINGRADYRVKKLQLSASYRQAYDVNAPLSFSLFSSHSRDYTANASWSPNSWFTVDASYMKLHLDSLSFLAFFAGVNRPQLQTSYSSLYISNIHAANLGARFGIGKRAYLYVGYNVTRDTGDGRASAVPAGTVDPVQALLSSVQTFPLNYQTPLARVSIRITPKLRWNGGWQFYDYAEDFHLLGYAQNYHAQTGYTSLSWSF